MVVRKLRVTVATVSLLLAGGGVGCSQSHTPSVGDSCAREADCGSALTCAAGRCAEVTPLPCIGGECDAGTARCEDGGCGDAASRCTSSGECAPGQLCDRGSCVMAGHGGCPEGCPAGTSCLDAVCVPEGTAEGRDVDMLFVVDDSNSMREEQVLFATKFSTFVDIITSGDTDGDGMVEFFPPESLHVGVVSSDMGTGAYSVGGVCDAGLGQDGILQSTPNPDVSGCEPSYPSFLSFEPARDDAGTFSRDFECIARLGTGGCGFEQQLEAGLKALTPSTSRLRFSQDTAGHGDGANQGFVRPGSILVVVVLTDEDDCSVEDPELFNPDPANPTYPGNINLRCFQYPEAVHPVRRYVHGLLALRSDPNRLIYAPIAGVPPDLAEDPAGLDYDALLDDPRMEERIAEDTGTRLEVACESEIGGGAAFPARRLVETARDLDTAGAHGVVGSVCAADFLPTLRAIADRLAEILGHD